MVSLAELFMVLKYFKTVISFSSFSVTCTTNVISLPPRVQGGKLRSRGESSCPPDLSRQVKLQPPG